MPRDCVCSADSDDASTVETLNYSRRHGRGSRSTRRDTSSSYDLREENLWLVQQLAISEANARRWQECVHVLKRQAQQHATEREQWHQTLASKEHQYDHHMRSLLQIVVHHEETHRVMRAEMETLKKSVEMTESSTQTEIVETMPTEVQSDCGDAGHVCVARQTATADEEVERHRHEQELEEQVAAELSPPAESIHEQYVTLTMQKLVKQLRQSNLQAVHPTPALAAPSSFRESIRKRLMDNKTASVDMPSFLQSAGSFGSRVSLNTGRPVRSPPPKLPVLDEQDVIPDTPASRLRHLSPSAA